MPSIADAIELQTFDKQAMLCFEKIERYPDGSAYHCQLIVQSRGFGYNRQFHFDDHYLRAFIEALRSMINGSPGKALLRHEFEDDTVEFEMNRLGRVVVRGELVEHSTEGQALSFAFLTDQTVLHPLVQAFEVICPAETRNTVDAAQRQR